MPKHKIPLIDRLMQKVRVDEATGCWIFTGAINNKGYGKIGDENNKIKDAHRVAYRLLKGPLPDGVPLDHRCHSPERCQGGVTCPHRRCVNPDHLEISSTAENCSRERSCYNPKGTELMAMVNRGKTHCVHGHEFTEENTYFHDGKRACKTCKRRITNEWVKNRRRNAPPKPPKPAETHCQRGHEFNPENTYTDPTTGKRTCRECRRAGMRAWYRKTTLVRPVVEEPR